MTIAQIETSCDIARLKPVPNIVAIIQARMSSTRFEGKVLKDIRGKPMLERIVERVEACKLPIKIVVATTVNEKDKAIVKWAQKQGMLCFRGSEEDVLSRYYIAALDSRADIVVRLTADNPLTDPRIIDKVVGYYLETKDKYDYVSNTLILSYPEGLRVEVFPTKVLAKAYNDATLPHERQHVTPYIINHPDIFRLANVAHGEDLSYLRWTVDYPADLEYVRGIYSFFPPTSIFHMEDILKLKEVKERNIEPDYYNRSAEERKRRAE